MHSYAPTRIRAATRTDLPAVAALAGEIWRTHYPPIVGIEQTEYMLGRMYSPEALDRLLAAPGSALDLLVIGDRLAGYVAYGAGAAPGELKLDKLYVHHDCHGLGHGSRLIARVETEARRRACSAIVLNVHQRNAIAVRAYERNGFVVRKAFGNDFGNGNVMDDYEMVKALILFAVGVPSR
jgi:diamine N-acetyltransferase